jgi:hypothetical protein
MSESIPIITALCIVFAAHIVGRFFGYREGVKDAKAIFLADRDEQPTITHQGE